MVDAAGRHPPASHAATIEAREPPTGQLAERRDVGDRAAGQRVSGTVIRSAKGDAMNRSNHPSVNGRGKP